jgi:hypothetical protein
MGFWEDLGHVIIGGVLGGPAGAITVFGVEHGEEVIEVTIDLANEIVQIGADIYRAIPPEAFAVAGDPLHWLLKKEFEDEIILLGEIAGKAIIVGGLTWPALGPVGAIALGAVPLYVATGSLIGKIHFRKLNDQEWEMAQYIFRDSLDDRDNIILTDIGGKDGRAFVLPTVQEGPVFVNLGKDYEPNLTIPCGAVLFHELTHVWQSKKRILLEIYLYSARVQPDVPVFGEDDPYLFTPGSQWKDYNIEQQASIVEAWTVGATEKTSTHNNLLCGKGTNLDIGLGSREPFTINSPLFRYINGNVRRFDNGADTSSGGSVRKLLADGGHPTIKDMHPSPPPVWWSMSIQVANYSAASAQLDVTATSMYKNASLEVFITSNNQLIGTLAKNARGEYTGRFSLTDKPERITVRSNYDGEAISAVS